MRKRIRVRASYVVLGLLMTLFAFKFIEKAQDIRHLGAQENYLRSQNQQIADQNHRLQSDIHYYGTSDYVKNEARAVFGYSMPGEVVVQSKPAYAPTLTPKAAPSRAPPADPVWKQWWHVFFG